jgi:hypothetical protein
MDIASTALTNAWLQAVWRVQFERAQPANITGGERTMTDVIEHALRGGGLDTQDPQWVDPTRPGRLVDRLS